MAHIPPQTRPLPPFRTPLENLVIRRMEELALGRRELVERLGWHNPSRGLRRLDAYLATGEKNSHLLRELPRVLEMEEGVLEGAEEATHQELAATAERKARARFRPHILVEARPEDGARRPWFIQALAQRHRVLELPDGFARLSLSRQVRHAAHMARRHFRRHRGILPVFGIVSGYRLQRTLDHAVILNTDGTIREAFERSVEPPAPELRVKGKRIPVETLLP